MNVNEYEIGPLISIVCLTYNQENFVKEAVLSLLSQDYKNIEIIISDDCSLDNTFKILDGTLSGFEGLHNVVLRQTKKNLGLGLHLEEVLKLAKGEYFFLAAGDDISYPNRVSTVVEFIKKGGFKCKAVFSNLMVTDKDSNKVKGFFKTPPVFSRNIDDFKVGLPVWAVGASLVIHRSLYDKYGGFVPGTFQEDGCFAFRAILEGEIEYFDEITVGYRSHDSNISQNLSLKDTIEFKKNEYILWENYYKDAFLYNSGDKDLLNAVVKGKRLAVFKRKLLSNYLIAYLILFFNRILKNRLLFK